MSEDIVISRDTDRKVQTILYVMGVRLRGRFSLVTMTAVLPKDWRTVVVLDSNPGHIEVRNANDKVVFRVRRGRGLGRQVMLGPGN